MAPVEPPTGWSTFQLPEWSTFTCSFTETIQQYVKKGSKIYVEGRLRKRKYVAKDGQKRITNEIVADNMIMLGHRPARGKSTEPVSSKLIREDVDVEEIDE